MKRINKAVAACAAVALISLAPAAARAQSAQPAATPSAKSTPPAAAPSKPRSAVSVECSQEADAKELHGKARREFRSECRKNAIGKPG